MSKRLYVGNISFKATEDDLRGLFTRVGAVDSAKLVIDRVTGKLRGFGFVEMTTPEEATSAIEMLNDSEFMGRKLVVNIARPKESRAY